MHPEFQTEDLVMAIALNVLDNERLPHGDQARFMKKLPTHEWLSCILAAALLMAASGSRADQPRLPAAKLYAQDNLIAWCIVPFDAKHRGPEERAKMMKRLGFTKFAY